MILSFVNRRSSPSDSLRASYAREGTRGFWRELLAIQDRRHAFPAYWVGLCYGQVGELDQAMTWLERSAELRESHLLGIRTDSLSDPLLPSPRFHALLRRMHLEA